MSRTLLLADGSITIQRVIELTFAHEDMRVISVSDGRRAVQILDTEQPDVVLIDVDLPEMDGYQLTAHVRRVPRLKNVPVLLLAGAFEPIDQEKARDVGSDGVIMKPFEPQVVVTRVRELIDQRDRMATPHVRPETPSAAASPAAVPTRPTPVPDPPPAPVEPVKPGRAESPFLRVAPREKGETPDEPVVLETLELPARPMWEATPSKLQMSPEPVAPSLPTPTFTQPISAQSIAPPPVSAPPKVTLANAFTALLAAEQSSQPAGLPATALSEASIEDAVRRVLVRMTDDLVRRIVLDTAERLIREEIDKIKSHPD